MWDIQLGEELGDIWIEDGVLKASPGLEEMISRPAGTYADLPKSMVDPAPTEEFLIALSRQYSGSGVVAEVIG